jgi:hypothetical protein
MTEHITSRHRMQFISRDFFWECSALVSCLTASAVSLTVCSML